MGQAKVGPATEVNDRLPGPSLETGGVEEARAVARAPFALEALRGNIAAIEEAVSPPAQASHPFNPEFKTLSPKAEEPAPVARDAMPIDSFCR